MVTAEYKEKVAEALIAKHKIVGGDNAAFARSMDINPSIYSRINKGERDNVLAAGRWISLGRELGVSLKKDNWKVVETDVFKQIRDEIMLCKQHGFSRIFVDNCGIGKTFTAKYLARTQKNVFYIDGTQCRRRNALIKTLARVIGVELSGKVDEIKEDTKYYLTLLEDPIVIIDEAGALDKDALGLVQEYWNYTDEGACAWYLMGANAMRNKIERGVRNDRDYFAELFSRFSEKFSSIVPIGEDDKKNFYKKLIRDVISANITDKSQLDTLVNKCLIIDKETNTVSGLRRAKALLKLNNA